MDKKKIYWIIKQILLGILEGILYSIVYIYLLPFLLTLISSTLSNQITAITSLLPSEIYIYIGLFVGLDVVARIMKGTIYNPLLRATSSLLGLLIILSYFNNGILSAGPITINGVQAYITLNLSIILLIYIAFIIAPGIIIPFIEYFVENK
ncbi:hypothetical protein Calag_0544 [Caldisphaera lagunensis DSM 15908]|uniref:Uncharacterized protein n=1 Tax=Caldisphaera lagunensis (strain DSM 15908 / JCM 11604 / ANMR 0165 / IC-154) TaxID=1056495 RepID=L0AA54_CALLD|nr:hypothetical protein [Caldisphaera lagunensis]AFZ70304.1 hypothetical protein Calag_0544 [Caldisphaera lagunensis DSM 15908]